MTREVRIRCDICGDHIEPPTPSCSYKLEGAGDAQGLGRWPWLQSREPLDFHIACLDGVLKASHREVQPE
jgi:hypothetical protein